MKKRIVAVTALLAVAALSGVSVSASIPNSVTGEITGCVKNQGGAVRIVDAQAGVNCATDERAVRWPGRGGAATQYFQGNHVNLSHDANQETIVLVGPVLPAGIWEATMIVTVGNNTGQQDNFRCGLFTGSGAPINGGVEGVPGTFGVASLSVPGLVTLTSPERINIQCRHDHALPAGQLVAADSSVRVEQVTSRF
ncbi:hypothetical protein ALI144C_23875 [Actinosynnema sp. ALI-1.44]|uniref:hypothetical protein n=1 Tax=Actinosynnema sp. ALI-1.44 TaxID=1933779 RepID=UPI00097CAEAA|nr:hypothetical protein [Actinosynnema sp. ALI-1.44]ONI79783.1 hypothetical protein ALI144C_23875 [Actinosynnema sp. ALI-1.44]